MAFCRERNVLLRPLGNTVYVMPPYCIDEADLDIVYSAIEEGIADQLTK
jgi:adenosylmethionine-8-amino-7-oxononanoate aminotransferase